MGGLNWYEKWLAEELRLPMSFGRYIGEERGKDPGATITEDVLKTAHQKVLEKISEKSKKHTEEEMKDLESFLTGLFFPKNSTQGNQSLTSRFLQVLLSEYETYYNEAITLSEKGTLGAEINKVSVKPETWERIKEKAKTQNDRQNMALSTLAKKVEIVKNVMREDKTGKRKADIETRAMEFGTSIEKSALEMYNAWDLFYNVFFEKTVKGKMDDSGHKKELSLERLISKRKLPSYQQLKSLKSLKGKESGEVISLLNQAVKEFDEFCYAMEKLYIVNPSTYGNVLEFGIALANYYNEFTSPDRVKAFVESDIQSKVGKHILGQQQVARGGNQWGASIDFKLFDENGGKKPQELSKYANDEDGATRDKGTFVLQRRDKFGNMEFNTSEVHNYSFETGTKKQAKTDVILTVPDVKQGGTAVGKTFQISAKNWGIVDEVHSLGETSIFNGFERTISTLNNEKIMYSYLYTMQHPISGEHVARTETDNVQERREIARRAVAYGHKLARESLMLDIATGYSQGLQKQKGAELNSADTLIIMDRAGKRIIAMDLNREVYNYMTKGYSKLFLEGYNPANVESGGRTARNAVRKSVSYKGRDRNYVGLMVLFLKGQKATVKLNQSLHTKF